MFDKIDSSLSRGDVLDSSIEDDRPTELRPWGNFTTIDDGVGYRMRMINMKPGHRQSMQSHSHRSEHIIVFGGILKIIKGDETIMLHSNESIYIPRFTVHRIENPGMVPSIFLSVETGEYLGDDDIRRYDDDYAR